MIHMSSYACLFPFPCRLQDVAGYGVALAVKDIYAAAFGTRNFHSGLVELMAKNGGQGMILNLLSLQLWVEWVLLHHSRICIFHFKFPCYFTGKINGKGYYLYEKGAKPKPDPNVQHVIDEYRKQAKTMPGGKVSLPLYNCLTFFLHLWKDGVLPHLLMKGFPDTDTLPCLQPVTLSDQDILEMVFFPVVNEACRVMDENVVIRAADLDIASVLGMGFPKYR